MRFQSVNYIVLWVFVGSMAQNNDSTDEPDLTNETAALGSGNTAIAVPEAFYPNVDNGGEWGVVTRDHGDRTELRNVTDWQLAESTAHPEHNPQTFDWIGDSFRDDGRGFVESAWMDTFRYEVTDGEGHTHVIELETEARE